MLRLPLSFDYSEDNYPGIEIKFLESRDCWEVCFTPLDLSFLYPEDPYESFYYLNIQKIEKLNTNFRVHGRLGYSLNSFHELFLDIENFAYFEFRIENAEVSLGETTPLGRFIFDREHNDDYHGEWDYISSVRLLNVDQDKLEVYLLNALNRIQVFTGSEASLKSVSRSDYISWLDQSDNLETDSELIINDQTKVYKDFEAMSLYRYALTARDSISACIYYYRIVEFYAFLRKHRELEKIRKDESLDSKAFSTRVHELVKANERENICGLVEELVTPEILNFAFQTHLTKTNSKKGFSNELYNFRNSIVHAKYEHKSALIVESILNPSSQVALWREVMNKLIPKILDKYGV